MKTCTKCKIEKTLNEFNKNKKKSQGVASICKECHSKYRKEQYQINKEREIEQVRAYQKLNPIKRGGIYEQTLKPNKKAGRIFEQKCPHCDNIVFVTEQDIETNKTKFCSKECKNKSNKSPYHHYFMGVCKRAIKRNFENDLTETFLKELLENIQGNKCAVTNVGIKIYPKNSKKNLHNTASLDRIDSTKGYTVDNVRWVCLGINYMKLDYDDCDIHTLLKLIVEKYKQ